MAFYLGKISKVARRELDLLRVIRNQFAHHPTIMTFKDEALANKCRELKFSFRDKNDDPRSHFSASVFGVLAQIHSATLMAEAPQEPPDDAPSEKQKAEHLAMIELMMKALKDGGT